MILIKLEGDFDSAKFLNLVIHEPDTTPG